MIALLAAAALAGPARLDRVDVLSDDPGRWWLDDAPLVGVAPGTTAARFLAQVQPVWELPRHWYVGTSLSSQSIRHEWGGDEGFSDVLGISTSYALPRGVLAGIAWRGAHVRVAGTVDLLSTASWVDLRWDQWSVQPALAIGWVNPVRAPWLKRTGRGAGTM